MTKEKYKELIEGNGYITWDVVTSFLRKGMIADFALVAEIYDNGMGILDYQRLQEALDKLDVEE